MEKNAYAVINNDKNIRLNSSSGGIFSLLAEETIKENGIVFGVQFSEDFSVEHGYTDNAKGIEKFRRSKYVQSRTGEAYKKCKIFLEEGRQVLFSGVPCQISGLKTFLGMEYRNLLSVDLICKGVPSLKVWGKYLEYIKTKYKSEIEEINFRCKYYGWYKNAIEIKFKNGKVYRALNGEDAYMKMFGKSISLRPSCYQCKYKTLEREADITIADFWGIHEVCPEMYDEKGTSLVIVHTEKGEKAFNNIKEKTRIKAVEIENAIKYNQNIIKSVKEPDKRRLFFENMEKMPIENLVKKYVDDPLIIRGYRFGRRYIGKIKMIIVKHRHST
jgi:coenzyme F420-reducing hydrogenase beta subunit